ncbi:MAG: hypothetical protein AAGG38_12595 [Planctomycetota bacterium]
MILIPYLRGRRELICSWNIFLLGLANYLGVSAWQSGLYWDQFEISRYTQVSDQTVMIFISGALLLMVGLCLGYYGRLGRFVEQRQLRWWPRATPVQMLFCIVAGCVMIVIGGAFLVRIPIVTQVLAMTGQAIVPVTLMLALALWIRSPINLSYLTVFLLVLAVGLVFSFTFGTSRRPLLALLAVFPILLYYRWGRHLKRSTTVIVLLVVAWGCITILGAHSQIRHRQNSGEGRITRAIETVRLLPASITTPRNLLQTGMLGSDATSVSLGLMEIGDQILPKAPLHTVQWLIANPIPRAWWPDKPEGVGQMLPRDLGQWKYGKVNWGVGIVGQFYYDGGLYIIPIYGFVLGLMMRWFDRMLMDQPDNVFLLGILAGFSAHWVAVPRGEVSLFILQSFTVFLAALPIYFVSRRLLGSAYATPPLPHPLATTRV